MSLDNPPRHLKEQVMAVRRLQAACRDEKKHNLAWQKVYTRYGRRILDSPMRQHRMDTDPRT